jgi:hypothetical protein
MGGTPLSSAPSPPLNGLTHRVPHLGVGLTLLHTPCSTPHTMEAPPPPNARTVWHSWVSTSHSSRRPSTGLVPVPMPPKMTLARDRFMALHLQESPMHGVQGFQGPGPLCMGL